MHEIRFFEYDIKKDRIKIIKEMSDQINSVSDSYWCGNVDFKEKIFDSYNEAVDYLENLNGFYVNVAVKYRETEKIKNKKIEDLIQRRRNIREDKEEYSKKNTISNRESAYIGCPNCGSKLNKNYLRSNGCPLCGRDLRSNTVIKTLNRYDERVEEINNKIIDEQKRLKDKAEVKWLIRAEYHV